MPEKKQKNPGDPASAWTLDKLSGQGRYVAEGRQHKFPTGLLAQVAEAALGAWRAIPSKGSVTTPLTKITQGPQESFSEFVGRLLETAERVLGPEETDSKFIKQLAYENANSACRAALRGRVKHKDLSELVRICNDVDPFTHKISQSLSQAVSLATGAALQATRSPKGCFKCG